MCSHKGGLRTPPSAGQLRPVSVNLTLPLERRALQGVLNHGVEVAQYLREIGCDQVCDGSAWAALLDMGWKPPGCSQYLQCQALTQ